MDLQFFFFFFLLLLFLLSLAGEATAAAIRNTISPNCTERCGDVLIPYPFGIGDGCYFDESFSVICQEGNRPEVYAPFQEEFFGVTNISLSRAKAQMKLWISYICYDSSGNQILSNDSTFYPTYDLSAAFRLSNVDNKFTTIGCNSMAVMYNGDYKMIGGCFSTCNSLAYVRDGYCTGEGCCQIANFDDNIQVFSFDLTYFDNFSHSQVHNISPCSSAFFVDQDSFQFRSTDLSTIPNKYKSMPVVVDWAIRSGNKTCQQAQADNSSSSYACRSNNSECLDSINGPGYICNCSIGFQGNPYLSDGCQDIDECILQPDICPGGICINTLGSYICTCQPGYYGDAKNGTCIANRNHMRLGEILAIAISASIASLILLLSSIGVWSMVKKRKIRKRKQSYYKKNVALLHEDQNPSDIALVEKMKIYDLEDLEKATNNFDKTRIIGGGGHGHVFKGLMLDQRVVAIKKPKINSEDELKQFVNEIFILSQTSQRNVVKFFGCCLQVEVPLLVFEFISGGTLRDHLVNDERLKIFTYKHRLRIATEIASALSYLHSYASITIFHRDIKSSNILIDERGEAKVADFGASRVVPLDQVSIMTKVQGTYGYLDPEYHQTQKLTNKSDVYSFGVILVELLTGKVTTRYKKDDQYRNIVMDFIESMRENTMYKILDPWVLKEAEADAEGEEIERLARLAQSCLRLYGNERPTMEEVLNELKAIRLKKSRDHESGTDERYSRFDQGEVSSQFASTSSNYKTTQYSFEIDSQTRSLIHNTF